MSDKNVPLNISTKRIYWMKRVLSLNQEDLCFIPIEFTDANGLLKPYIEQDVEISVSGAATLQGFGSALCKTDETYLGSHFHAFRGRCLAVLRAGTEAGTATITVRSAGMAPVSLDIEMV